MQYYPFTSILPALQAGSIDLIIGGVYITEERQREMFFQQFLFQCLHSIYRQGWDKGLGKFW